MRGQGSRSFGISAFVSLPPPHRFFALVMAFVTSSLNKLKGGLANAPGDLKDYRSRTSGPSSYKPAGPDSGAVFHTSKELAQSSSVLHQEARRHIVPPPPRRGTVDNPPKPSVSPIEPAAAPPPAPARSARAPSISQPVPSTVRGTPAPPYQHAKSHDFPGAAGGGAPGRKLFSQFNQDDKEDFFASLDDVSFLFL